MSVPFYPTHLEPRIESTSKKYIVRPYEPRHYDQIRAIFKAGMNEYGVTPRPLFPYFDEAHKTLLQNQEIIYSQGYAPYTEYCLEDENLKQPEKYWNINKRSILLVACLRDEPDIIHGLVAIQPISYNANVCKYASTHINTLNNAVSIENNNDNNKRIKHNWNDQNNNDDYKDDSTKSFFYSKILSLLQLSMGTLPYEYYHLDDPLYEPKSFISSPTVILPTIISRQSNPSIQNVVNNNNQNWYDSFTIPFPINDTNCKCKCYIDQKCSSQTISLKMSKMTKPQRLSQIKTLHSVQGSLNSHFCQCVLQADTILTELSHSPRDISAATPLICPFCIKDGQYLIPNLYIPISTPGLLPNGNDNNNHDNPKSIPKPTHYINPIVFQYPNTLSQAIIDIYPHTQDNHTPHLHNLPLNKTPVTLYKSIPHGYHRRFLSGWMNLTFDSLKTTPFYSEHGVNINNPNCCELFTCNDNIDTFLTVPINAYTTFANNRDKILSTTITPDNNNPFTHWTTYHHYDSHSPHPDLNTTAELRRMSLSVDARGTGLGPFLFLNALLFAKFVLKFRYLHLSTSYVMDAACAFYKKMGMRETWGGFDAFDEQWPVTHYDIPLTRRGFDDSCYKYYSAMPFTDVGFQGAK
jgi:hypothetical protein